MVKVYRSNGSIYMWRHLQSSPWILTYFCFLAEILFASKVDRRGLYLQVIIGGHGIVAGDSSRRFSDIPAVVHKLISKKTHKLEHFQVPLQAQVLFMPFDVAIYFHTSLQPL